MIRPTLSSTVSSSNWFKVTMGVEDEYRTRTKSKPHIQPVQRAMDLIWISWPIEPERLEAALVSCIRVTRQWSKTQCRHTGVSWDGLQHAEVGKEVHQGRTTLGLASRALETSSQHIAPDVAWQGPLAQTPSEGTKPDPRFDLSVLSFNRLHDLESPSQCWKVL